MPNEARGTMEFIEMILLTKSGFSEVTGVAIVAKFLFMINFGKFLCISVQG
jgi:hypothetical protein